MKTARIQARMTLDAKSRILQSGDFLRAGEITKLTRDSDKIANAEPTNWKRSGTIFAIEHKGVEYFPLYALDPDKNYRPYKAVAEILRIFGDNKSGWGVAFWFASLNGCLDDRRPQDLLALDPNLVISAAKDELNGVQHG